MQTSPDAPLNDVFSALAHPLRRAIMADVAAGPRTVVQLAEPHAVSLNAMSRHIKVLENANLVSREIRGNSHFISAHTQGLRPALDWLDYHVDLWSGSLLALKAQLERDT